MGTVRMMQIRDLDQILALENQHQLHPWSRAVFEQALRTNQFCIVFESEEGIQGYGVANRGHGRTICAVDLAAADALYHAWFAHARTIGTDILRAEIEPDNRAARIRLKRYGFEPVGTIPAFYGPGHDAHVYARRTPRDGTGQNETVQGFPGIPKNA